MQMIAHDGIRVDGDRETISVSPLCKRGRAIVERLTGDLLFGRRSVFAEVSRWQVGMRPTRYALRALSMGAVFLARLAMRGFGQHLELAFALRRQDERDAWSGVFCD